MINIKYLLIIGFVIGAMAFISPLSASDDVDVLKALDITPFSEDTVVTIDGIDFNIPKGYGEDKGLTKDNEIDTINGIDFITFMHSYKNKDLKFISIDIYYDAHKTADVDSLPTDGQVKKTIKGNEGYLLNEEGYCSFTYSTDGKIIMVTAENENVISDVII